VPLFTLSFLNLQEHLKLVIAFGIPGPTLAWYSPPTCQRWADPLNIKPDTHHQLAASLISSVSQSVRMAFPLLCILLVPLTAAVPLPDDGCTRDVWEQLPSGQFIQVRRNVCGVGGVSVPPEPVVVPSPSTTSPPPAAVTGGQPPVRQNPEDPNKANTTTTARPVSDLPPPSPTPPAVVVQAGAGFSANKQLLIKKLKLLALGALLLG
jgi:hypothetical protein